MGAIDWPSLLLLLAAGFCLGLYGLFGFDAAGWMLGEQYKSLANAAVGISALWQFFRQPWWGRGY
jgi:uncharacterized membrane protein YuzA (DUF378 family)